MSIGIFLICLGAGAGLIAIWVYVRLGSGRVVPTNMRAALIHVGVSLVLGQLLVPPLVNVISGQSVPLTLIAVFGIAFPALVYCLLSSLWIIRILQGAVRHR